MDTLLNPGYYDEHDLKHEGFRSIGKDVSIARNCTIIGAPNISIGNHVRIDGYSTIVASEKAEIKLGSFIHIGGHSVLIGGNGIVMEDFSGLSQGVKIYSRSDDYSGNSLTNPMIPDTYKTIKRGQVTLKKHVIIGAGAIILPGVTIEEGSSIGALSLVVKNVDCWGIYAGCPVKKIKDRNKKLRHLEDQFILEYQKTK